MGLEEYALKDGKKIEVNEEGVVLLSERYKVKLKNFYLPAGMSPEQALSKLYRKAREDKRHKYVFHNNSIEAAKRLGFIPYNLYLI